MEKNNNQLVTCSVCGVTAKSIAGKQHRRCAGLAPGVDENGVATVITIRPKTAKLPRGSRGKWQ